MTMITPSYLGETIEYSSLHACRSTLEDPTANSPRAYYPGDAYVDWVGTDFYSLYPNFGGLQRFYSEHPRKPFAFGEWALWNGDDAGWVRQLFSFIASHPRVRMALYNQGERTNGPFRLSRYPNARHEIRRLIASPRFLAFTPEWAIQEGLGK